MNNLDIRGACSRLFGRYSPCLPTKRSRRLWTILLIPLLLALILPLANIYIIYPAFTDVIVQGTEKDAARLGKYILPASLKHTELNSETLSQQFFGQIFKLENDFGLMKVKVFSASGEVLYSTEPTDIGHLNDKSYFKDIVVKGRSFTKLVTKDTKTLEGQRISIDVVETYVPFMNNDQFLGAFEMYYDITERKERMNQLVSYSQIAMALLSVSLIFSVVILLRKEAANQQANDLAEQLKEEVERITRHDLKAPIIGMLSGLEYLEHFSQLTEEQASITADMRKAANTAMDLINRSFDLYRMETGSYSYEPSAMDMLAVAHRAATDLSGMAKSRGVTILITRSGSIPAADDTLPIIAEETLCYSLVANLLKNAIEASESGDRVTMALAENGRFRLTVHNPAAVPEEIRTTFFEKYATAGKPTGTGIGTYSARLMTQTMGGTIDMTTSESDGTKVIVTLPMGKKTN